MSHRFAVLFGNGVSMAYNSSLGVRSLTEELVSEFEKLGASEAEKALKRLADEAHGDTAGGFESMLGPIEAVSRSLDAFVDLEGVVQLTSAAQPLRVVRTFAEELHRIGLATILGRIADLSHGAGASSYGTIGDVGSALTALGPAENLTVATLNYDGLTHAGLLPNHDTVADLAHGGNFSSKEVVSGTQLAGYRLRDHDDLLVGRTHILQLHGSLGWLREPGTNVVWRFGLGDLRNADFWGVLKQGNTKWTPAVVLTDQKERMISRRPFDLAYDIFQQRLISADRWLIAGYGVGDTPVNELYRSAWNTRKRLQLPEPSVLLVDYGRTNTSEHVRSASVVLGIPVAQITMLNDGIAHALTSPQWAVWSS